MEMAGGQTTILYETELSFQLKESHCTGECHQQAFGKLVVEGCSCWRDAPSPDLPEAINCFTIASPPLQMSLVSTSSTILPQVFNNIVLEYQKQAIDAAMLPSDTVEEKLEDTDAAQWLQCPVQPIASLLLHVAPPHPSPLHPSTQMSLCPLGHNVFSLCWDA